MAVGLGKAIRDLLLQDEPFCAYLSTYMGEKAIFTADRVPPDANMPFLMLGPPVTDEPDRIMDGESGRRTVTKDLKLYFPGNADEGPLEEAAERLRNILADRSLTVPGFSRARIAIVNGPIGLSADTDADGRLVSIRVHLTR
ncbi:MAG: hypothetical protein RJA36_1440 [Pseudomonadota bacterium]|jgi:hypothetical protein